VSDVLDRAQALEEMERAAGVLAVRSLCSAPTNPFAGCLGCGEEIEPARRAALPSALRCLECQEALERRERGL
jgi:phage/conjugal plasmid C-4 type zinc finger TraR family protein